MKKNLMFVIPMVVIAVLLFMLCATGMTAHIALSVIGLVVLVAYALTTKKTWKCPALEILHRVCYAIALITGGLLMNVHGIAALAVVHRGFACLFMLAFVFLFVHKLIQSKKV